VRTRQPVDMQTPESPAPASQTGIDPAALLAGLLTVAAVSLLEEGSWELMDTVIAAVASSVLLAFFVWHDRWDDATRPEQCAVGVVLAVALAVVSAYPLQDIRADQCNQDENVADCVGDKVIPIAGTIGVAASVGLILCVGPPVRQRFGRRETVQPRDAARTSDPPTTESAETPET